MYPEEQRARDLQAFMLDSIKIRGGFRCSIHFLRDAFPPEQPVMPTHQEFFDACLAMSGHRPRMTGQERCESWCRTNGIEMQTAPHNNDVVFRPIPAR